MCTREVNSGVKELEYQKCLSLEFNQCTVINNQLQGLSFASRISSTRKNFGISVLGSSHKRNIESVKIHQQESLFSNLEMFQFQWLQSDEHSIFMESSGGRQQRTSKQKKETMKANKCKEILCTPKLPGEVSE